MTPVAVARLDGYSGYSDAQDMLRLIKTDVAKSNL